MTKTPRDKTDAKRGQWLERTSHALQVSESETEQLLTLPRLQSLRINPLNANDTTLEKLKAVGWSGKQYDWYRDGYTIDAGLQQVRDSDVVARGEAYIQNAASWLPVIVLAAQASETVLDVCAAPGGKTSHIAAQAANQAQITANDNSRPRLAKLRANLERMGVSDVTYTLYDASQLVRKLGSQQFDKILLDAPCSGEGMMRYAENKDFTNWSVAQIKRLQKLQKRLIMQAWYSLKPGGSLVYSTCTMAPEENEAVIDYLLRHAEDARAVPITIKLPNQVPTVRQWNAKEFRPEVRGALRLKPSTHIEAFFVCKITKDL